MSNVKYIVVASDHAGYKEKIYLANYLKSQYKEYSIIDVGCDNEDSCDYPDFAFKGSDKIVELNKQHKDSAYGVFICGTGIGISIAANRNPDIKCSLVHNISEVKLSKSKYSANSIAMGARVLGKIAMIDIINEFLK